MQPVDYETRNAEIRVRRAQGELLDVIARDYSITRERVRQITLDIPAPRLPQNECIDCQKPIGNGAGRKAKRCVRCAGIAKRVWSEERIIAAIREFAAEYGEPPAAVDFNPALLRHRNPSCGYAEAMARKAAHDWPGVNTVQHRFGSWTAALEAAGFGGRSPGEHVRTIRNPS
jgi:hypothetical protein